MKSVFLVCAVIAILITSCIFNPLKRNGKIIILNSGNIIAYLSGKISGNGVELNSENGELIISALTEGYYNLSVSGYFGSSPDKYDFMVNKEIFLSDQQINSGMVFNLSDFKKKKIRVSGNTKNSYEGFSENSDIYLISGKNEETYLFGNFRLNEYIYFLSDTIEGIIIQDNIKKFQLYSKMKITENEEHVIPVDQMEFGNFDFFINEESKLSPDSLSIKLLPDRLFSSINGKYRNFKLNTYKSSVIMVSDNTSYSWDINFTDGNYSYSLKSSDSCQSTFGVFINVGAELKIVKPVKASYSIGEKISFKLDELISDSENSILKIQNAEYFNNIKVIIKNGTEIVFSERLNSMDTFNYYIDKTGNYKLHIILDTGNWQGEIQDIFDLEFFKEAGAFKIVNSFGKGGWEKIPDGFYWMTYDAMKQAKTNAWVVEQNIGYEPVLLAVIDIEHQKREDITVSFGSGDINNPSFEKTFFDYHFKGGPLPFPDGNIALDITDLLPVTDEKIYIKIEDSDKNIETGLLKSFRIELYDNYDKEPVIIYSANDLPLNTSNKYPVYSYIFDNYSLNTLTDKRKERLNSPLYKNSRKPTEEELKEILQIDTDQEKQNYNLRILDSYEIINSDYKNSDDTCIDHSKSIYFPPVGNQGDKNSCVTWSAGYYISSFYTARSNNTDLSEAVWIDTGNNRGYPDKSYWKYIMSPDFIYSQINDGGNNPSAYLDACNLIVTTGVCTWENMPYSYDDFTKYPDEAAWRDAAKNRSRYMDSENVYYLKCENDENIETLKNLLRDGYLITIAVNSAKYDNLSSKDILYSPDNLGIYSNHANTLVGFDDEIF